MVRVRQNFDPTALADVRGEILKQLLDPEFASLVHKGDRVAVGIGSRGIHQMDTIAAAVIDALVQLGAYPFIVPAMGSHGSATSEGQRQVLASYGITEETMGVPIDASMDTVFLGETENHIPIHFSKAAYEADWVLPINRIKAHTDFSGHIESGVIKMLTIGFGKELGCSTLHHCGTERFAQIIPEAARKVLDTVTVRFGLAIVENAFDHTALVRPIKGEDFMDAEPILLQQSRKMMPSIPFSKVDVLIVEQFGKDISGAGMDPNITGRRSIGPVENFTGPDIQRIVVLELTPASHGNAIAINTADFITRRLFDQIDLRATYKNSLACCNPLSSQIPVIADDEEEAIAFAISCCRDIDPANPRIVRIRDTLSLSEFLISEALVEEARSLPNVDILE